MRRYSSRRAMRCSSSSSSSSSSNSSSSSSNSGSTSTSDECTVKQPADKFERLRRIFLSQPSKSEKRAPRSASAGSSSPPRRKSKALSPVARQAFESSDRLRSRRSSAASMVSRQMYSEHEKDEEIESSTDENAQQSQLSIVNHVHSLCEHVKRMTLQRESTANQMHEMLDQAIEELQFLKKQEERSLQSHIKQIEENFALRLEVFEQQYVAKVAEIQREMQTAIQQQRARAEATILAAAKQLQEKTQLVVLPNPSLMGNHGSFAASTRAGYSVEDRQNRPSSVPIRLGDHRSRANMCDVGTLPLTFGARQPPRELRQPNQSSYEEDGGDGDADVELSPIDKQKAKLRALEAKLASFSQDSVDRIASELKSGVGLSKKRSFTRKLERAETSRDQQMRQETSPPRPSATVQAENASSKTWKPTPLSPLRKNRSYWRRGISIEAKSEWDGWDAVANGNTSAERAQRGGDGRRGSRTSQRAGGTLSSRFLLPEEEQELRHLRNSIGLAKDWMERHH